MTARCQLALLLSALFIAVGCSDSPTTDNPRDGASDASTDLPSDAVDADATDLDATADTQDADATDLLDDATFPPLDYDAFWSLDRVQTFWVTLTEDEWNALLHDYDENNRNEVYRSATLRWGESPDRARVFGDVGFRIRGNVFTRTRPEGDGHDDGLHHPDNLFFRPHFKIRFDERFDEDESVYGPPSRDLPEIEANRGRGLIEGIESLNLKFNNGDPTYLREVLAFDLFRRMGVPAPSAAFVRLFLTIGEEAPRYIGLYILIEQLDADWVRRHFDESAPLFKCLYQSEGPADLSIRDLAPGRDAGLIGVERTDPEEPGVWPNFEPYRPSYDMKVRRDDFDAAEAALNELITLLRGRDPTREALEAALDVDGILRMMAVNAFLGMADDYWRLGNNYYLVQRPDDGRWLTIPWDYDRTFGIETIGPDTATSSFLDWGSESIVEPVLMERLMAVPEFRMSYLDHVESIVEPGGEGTEEAFTTRMQALQDLIAPYTSDFDVEDAFPYSPDLSELTNYVRTRVTTARDELESRC